MISRSFIANQYIRANKYEYSNETKRVLYYLLVHSLSRMGRKVFEYIDNKESVTSRIVADKFHISIQNASNHLINMRKWGLLDVEFERDGYVRYYSIHKE